MKVLISEKLSEHKYKTPEGYLICTDAILARTGKQSYTKDELFQDGDNTEVNVDRPYDEVMNAKTIASFENKPITFDHPDEDVNVGNYKDYAIGYVRDVHQGKTDKGEDVILGNLVITDQDAINAIEQGDHTDLSCGYDCDIRDDGNGNYSQTNIRGNHLALCEQGRAGIAHIVDSKVIDKKRWEVGYRVRYEGRWYYVIAYNKGDWVLEPENGSRGDCIYVRAEDSKSDDSKVEDAAIGGHYKNNKGENFFICSYGSGFSIFKADGEYLDGSRHLSLDGVKQRILSYNLTKVKDSEKDSIMKDESEDWTEMLIKLAVKNGKNSSGDYEYDGDADVNQVRRVLKKLGYKANGYVKNPKSYLHKLHYYFTDSEILEDISSDPVVVEDDNLLGKRVRIRKRYSNLDGTIGTIYSYEGTNYDDEVEVKRNGHIYKVDYEDIEFLDSKINDISWSWDDLETFIYKNYKDGPVHSEVDEDVLDGFSNRLDATKLADFLEKRAHVNRADIVRTRFGYGIKVYGVHDSKANDADKYSYRLAKTKNDYDEYVVKAYKNGKYDEDASYYTDDWQDALDTLKMMAKREGLNFRQEGSRYIADSIYDSNIVDRPEGAFKQISNALSSYTPTKLVVLGHGWKWKVSTTPQGIVADFVGEDERYGIDPHDMSRISTDSLKQDLQTYLQSKMQQHIVTVNSASFIKTSHGGIGGVRFRIGTKLKKDSLDNSIDDSNIVDALSSSEKDLCDYMLENCREEDEDENDLLKKMKLYYSEYSSLARSKPNEVLDYFREHIDNFEDSVKDSSNLSTSKALKLTKIVSMLHKK